MEDLVRQCWVYENGTQLHVQEARRGVLSGEITVKGIEKAHVFRGFYETTRLGPRLTIPNLPSYIIDSSIDITSLPAEEALRLEREGPQIELQGSFTFGEDIALLHTQITFMQMSRRGRSRSHNPSNGNTRTDFSPSISDPTLITVASTAKHRQRCYSKDMVVQQAPTRTITWEKKETVGEKKEVEETLL